MKTIHIVAILGILLVNLLLMLTWKEKALLVMLGEILGGVFRDMLADNDLIGGPNK
jgi:hypothetical protein